MPSSTWSHRRGGGLLVDAVGEADEHQAVELVGDGLGPAVVVLVEEDDTVVRR